jgi:hypothetical protein
MLHADGSLQIPNYTRTTHQMRQMEHTSQSKAYLETCRAPANELNRPLRLDTSDGCLNILGNDITTVQKAARD